MSFVFSTVVTKKRAHSQRLTVKSDWTWNEIEEYASRRKYCSFPSAKRRTKANTHTRAFENLLIVIIRCDKIMNLWNFIRRLSSLGWIFEFYLHSMHSMCCGATIERQTVEKVSKELIEAFQGLSPRRAHLNATCWRHPQAAAKPFLETNFGNTFHARFYHRYFRIFHSIRCSA